MTLFLRVLARTMTPFFLGAAYGVWLMDANGSSWRTAFATHVTSASACLLAGVIATAYERSR